MRPRGRIGVYTGLVTETSRRQRFIVDLPASLVRRTMAFLSQENVAYRDLSEFLSVAAENQLLLETDGSGGDLQVSSPSQPERVSRPQTAVQPRLLEEDERSGPAPEASSADAQAGSQPHRKRRPRERQVRTRTPSPSTTPHPDLATSVAPGDLHRFLALPDVEALPCIEPESMTSDGSLSPFTNRLNPLVVPDRKSVV